MGANLKLGAHSNKYDTCECSLAIHAGKGCLISQGEQKLTSIPEDVVWVRSTPQQASSHKNDVRVVQQPVTRSMIIFPDIITILKYHSISWTSNIVTGFYNNISRHTSLWGVYEVGKFITKKEKNSFRALLHVIASLLSLSFWPVRAREEQMT